MHVKSRRIVMAQPVAFPIDRNAVAQMTFVHTLVSFAVAKNVHIAAVVASFGLFVLRGIWRFRAPRLLEARWVRVVPHVVDTILLASAIVLALLMKNYPGTHEWLTAKVIGLVLYVVLGSVALRYGRTPFVRGAALAGALAVFGYIVSVAVTKSPTGFIAWMR